MKNGSLSTTNGKVDHVEMVRCFGEPSLKNAPEPLQLEVMQSRADALQVQVAELERQMAATLREKELLLQEKEWLRGQVDKAQETIKLLEYRGQHGSTNERPKKGLFGRLMGAVLDE
jgi:predicted nuclease with TOPRIM domain